MSGDRRVVLVTGAGGALGRAYVERFAAAGYGIVVNDLGVSLDGRGTSAGAAEQLAGELISAGVDAVASGHDVATRDGARDTVGVALERFGRLDCVVNNAGFLRDRTLAKASPADLEAVVEVHLLGTMLVSRAALPALRASDAGRLVHTASAAVFGSFGQSNYAAAKLGIIGFSRSVALEEHRHGVLSNVVAPFARSRMTAGLTSTGDRPLGPELVAPVVEYLGSADCAITGQVLAAGAGEVASITVGITTGWHGPTDRPAERADIAAAIDTILDPTGCTFPASAEAVVARYLTGPIGASQP